LASETKFKETEIGMIPEEWYNTTLGSLVTFQRGHDLTFENKVEGPYPIVSSSGILGYHNEYKIKGPGVTVGRSGNSLGKAFFVSENYWPHNTILYVKKFYNVNPKFLYYLLKNLNLKEYNSGSAVPTLNRNYIHPIPVVVPKKLEEQKAISRVLSDLDDKIDLNHQINVTLEQIAQALFKHWFIGFEFPDENGNPYKSSGGRMVDSELGEIPEGWKVKKIDEILELAYGKALKEDIRIPGSVPVYGSNGQVGWHNEKLVDGPGIIVGRKGNPGTVTWVHTHFYSIDTTFYVVPKGPVKSLYYLLYALKKQDLPSFAADSAVPGLNRNIAYMNRMIVPGKDVLDLFDIYLHNIYQRIQVNEEQSRVLGSIRDSLLPKLMSGKIRVEC
jgi:type I restriction enzyme S subunit